MRLRPPSAKRQGEDGILPLINVVFLLLIFLLIAGRLTGPDAFKVTPPASISEAPGAVQDLTVVVAADGALGFRGARIEEAALLAALRAELQQPAAPPVRIKADGTADAAAVVALAGRLRAAGARDLRLLTLRAAGP